MSHLEAPNSNILIVDDTPENLRVLTRMLKKKGYQVRPAINGQIALKAIRSAPPDLILLDIMMPDMNGYEVCRRLKADETSRDIPVLFISALDEMGDKIKAFQVGGVDYITKPFQAEEVLARVETHLALRYMQKRLQGQNIQLQQEVAERRKAEEALRQSEQVLRELNASKDTFFSIIAHDLKGPLGSLRGLVQFTEEHLESYDQDQLKETLVLVRTATDNLFRLMDNLLTWSRVQRGIIEYSPQEINLEQIINRNISLFEAMAEQKQITLKHSLQGKVIVWTDLNMFDTIIRNLISNALKFTDAGGTVDVSARQDGDVVEVAISDTGIGIEAKHLPRLFRIDEKFKRLGTAKERGTGLGLILCKEFIERNRGKIWVESEIGKGTTFRFTLPKPIC